MDAREETRKHQEKVRDLLFDISVLLAERAHKHDASKLLSPEVEDFDKYTKMLKELTYGTDEYKKCLEELKPTLEHHYRVNPHHPEHYPNGVNGMSLVDIVEMFCDWKAATLRHADGDIGKSIEINKDRFELSEQLCDIFRNTVNEMEW